MITMPLTRTLPALAVVAALLATVPAFAQTTPTAPPPQAAPGPPITAQSNAGDPPARVGRLAQMNGTVSFHTADADQWSPATLNYPVTSGNALWTEPGAHAELQIGSGDRLVMDGGTELDIATLDDRTLAASVPQGRIYLQVDSVAEGGRNAIGTPRGPLDITAPGRYVIAAGDDDHPTTATVLEGAATIGDRAIPAGQTASLNGPLDSDTPAPVTLAAAQPDDFTQSALAAGNSPPLAGPRPAPATAAPPAMPQQVAGMTGAQDLAVTGTWSTEPQYGSVWYPPVEAGWVPYRDGHWAWVPPWGWTWVADEPWGFAPFHYGRWVAIHDRWAWSPGIHVEIRYGRPRPVYAPALVVFFGGGASIGVLTDDVGWVPLGWHEAYYPPYRVSRTYIRNVNIAHVTNITRVTNISTVNRVTINRYTNVVGATVVNRTVMRDARPVQRSVTPVSRQQYANLHPNRHPAIRPAAAPAGHASAPGPRIEPHDRSHDQPRAQAQRPPERHDPRSQRPQAQPRLPQAKPSAPTADDMVRHQQARQQQDLRMQQQQAARRQDEQRAAQAQDQRRQQDMHMQQQRDAARRQGDEQLARAQEQRRQQDIRLRQQRDAMQHQEQQRRSQQQPQQQRAPQPDTRQQNGAHDAGDRAPNPPGRP